ncbi:MFS transporter [Hungatella hathewayi]
MVIICREQEENDVTEKQKPQKRETIWNPVFINVFIINFLVHSCSQMMNTLTPKYASFLGAPSTIVGLVASMYAYTALIFKMFSAPAIDTFNRKYVLLMADFVIFLSFVGYAYSDSIPMLMASRLLQGTGLAFTTTCCLTIASDALPNSKMSSGIGYFALATALAQAIAPNVGLNLAEMLGYNKTFGVLAGIMVLAMTLVLMLKIDFVKTKKFIISAKTIVAKECIIPAFILFLLAVAYCVVNSFLVLFAETRGIGSNIGYFFTVYAGTMLFTRPFIGRMADRFGTVRVMIPSMCCFALAFLLISFSTSLPMFLLAAFISAFGYGGCQPAIQAVNMRSVPRERRGAASCTSYIGQDCGAMIGPTVAGAVVEAFGYANMWRIMILPIFLAMGVTVLFRYRINHAGEVFEPVGKPVNQPV